MTTDFGCRDYFIGSMKGVLLQQVPSVRLIDITHNIPRHDVISGAFVINESFRYFPFGTIHLIVVDPGVGTDRKKIIVSYGNHFFVTPDNGLLTYILKEKECRVFEVGEGSLLKFQDSPTFAGRDHFAPIAACLAKGINPASLGTEITTGRQIKKLFPQKKGNHISGNIVYFDHFGNAITNLRRSFIQTNEKNIDDFTVFIEGQGRGFSTIKKNYKEGQKEKGNLIFNSSGNLEIFVPEGSAKNILNLKIMNRVQLNILN
ncbi:MAG: S-adenosyl-l-methionine hydroxide adenosyltransferase family protein [Nitrospiria bacterium]